jgi:hypothetical protein
MIYFGFVAKLMFAFSSRFWPKACIFMWKTLIAAVSHVCWSPPPISAASRSHFHDASAFFWANCYICVSWNRLSKAHVLVCGMNGTTIEVTDFAVELLVW